MSNYSLTGSNDDVITFDNSVFVLNPLLTGLGIPPTSVRIDESARAGGVHRNTKRDVRNIDLPITVLGSTKLAVEQNLRRLARLTQDDRGPTRLTALRAAGNLVMEVHYTGGAELQYGESAGGQTFAKVLLSFQAPQPFWESAVRQSFTVSAGQTGRGLLPKLTKLLVSSATTLGIVAVSNTGDVPVFPVYTIRGPIANFSVRSRRLSFGFNAPVVTGDTITVDSERGTVIAQNGANRYDLLLPSPKFFSLPVGDSTLEIQGENTTLNTFVGVAYNQRFEVVHG